MIILDEEPEVVSRFSVGFDLNDPPIQKNLNSETICKDGNPTNIETETDDKGATNHKDNRTEVRLIPPMNDKSIGQQEEVIKSSPSPIGAIPNHQQAPFDGQVPMVIEGLKHISNESTTVPSHTEQNRVDPPIPIQNTKPNMNTFMIGAQNLSPLELVEYFRRIRHASKIT